MKAELSAQHIKYYNKGVEHSFLHERQTLSKSESLILLKRGISFILCQSHTYEHCISVYMKRDMAMTRLVVYIRSSKRPIVGKLRIQVLDILYTSRDLSDLTHLI